MSAQNLQNYIPPAQAGIQPCIMPVCQPLQQPQMAQQGTKGGNVGAVNITINGVNPPGQTAPPLYYPSYMPYYYPKYVPCQPQQPSETIGAQAVKQEIKTEPPAAAPLEKKPEEQKTKEGIKKPVIDLTDDYIRKLEENLLDENSGIRGKAAVELVKRFKEDETRKNEPRLMNLMNLALQDTSKPVVLTAMQALENGYASGNDLTIQRLMKIRDEKDAFGNYETAEGILTKLAGNNVG